MQTIKKDGKCTLGIPFEKDIAVSVNPRQSIFIGFVTCGQLHKSPQA